MENPDNGDRKKPYHGGENVCDAVGRQTEELRDGGNRNERCQSAFQAEPDGSHIAVHTGMIAREDFVTQHGAQMTCHFVLEAADIVLK
jgi:hypothetical protein